MDVVTLVQLASEFVLIREGSVLSSVKQRGPRPEATPFASIAKSSECKTDCSCRPSIPPTKLLILYIANERLPPSRREKRTTAALKMNTNNELACSSST